MEYSYVLVFVLVYSIGGHTSHINYPPCAYMGVVYNHGDAWVDKDACDVCQCGDYGLNCRKDLDGTGCKFNASVASPGDTVCMYGFEHAYLVGDVFRTLDGCNYCSCTKDGMMCSNKACDTNGFEQGSVEPIYGECLYDGKWYRFHTQWLSRDRCNTCYCYSVGNYQGGYVCTTSTCSNQNIITG